MTSSNNQMYNDIMAVGSKERPSMLALDSGKPLIDTKPNRELLRKCIYEGPYEMTLVQLEDTPSDDKNPRRPEAVHMILNGIGNDKYSIVDAFPNAKEMWIFIKRLQQGESINIQDVKTKLFWEFGKFTLRNRESIESHYTRSKGKEIVKPLSPLYESASEEDSDEEQA
ncbi:hypothetical protein Tco_1334971 [Tanacetum coccineum]